MPRIYLELGVFALIFGAGAVVLQQLAHLETMMPFDVGPAFFPAAMAIAMMGMAGLGAARTIAAHDAEIMTFPGGRKMLITLAGTVALFVLWERFGQFFVLGFVYLAGLLLLYFSDGPLTRRLLAIVILAAAVFMGAAHVFFTEILYTKF